MSNTESPLPQDPGEESFWEERYREGTTGWDLGQPAPPFVDLLSSPDAPPPGKMIVLGSGKGHDAIFFARQGFDVTAVDFAPSAVEEARKNAQAQGVSANFVQHDLFTLDGTYNHAFDYVLEHTCFAAIPIIAREEYVKVVRRLLRPTGEYIAIFFAHGRPGGPPFTTDRAELMRLFRPYFRIEELDAASRAANGRPGQELLARMRPRQDRNDP